VLRIHFNSCCDPPARIYSDFDEQLCSDVTPSRAATPSRGYIAASTSNCAPM